MKKLRFLLLDANVIIKLFELKLWDQVVERCDIVVAETVVGEAHFFETVDGPEGIDLSPDIDANRITVVSMTSSDIVNFRDRFSPNYFDQLDPGEAESLVYLLKSSDECLLSSADAIVFRVLGRLNRGEQGISMEEILQKIGLNKTLPDHYRCPFRQHWTKVGQEEMIRDIGLK